MERLRSSLICASLGLLVGATSLAGDTPIQMRVSPTVAFAPAVLTVRVSIQAASENRVLQVTVESPEYFGRSELSLNGEQSNRLNLFEFRDLPAGQYEVTSVLRGTSGPRASAVALAQVAPVGGR